MALYIKLKTKEHPSNNLNRFESAIKLFTIFQKKITMKNVKFYVFDYEPIDDFNPKINYEDFDFGIFNTHIIKQLKPLNYDSQIIKGLELKGKIKLQEKEFDFSFILNPSELSKNYYDIRFDILPNAHAETLIDLENYIPNLREIIFDRIKEYNVEVQNNYFIKVAVISDSGYEDNSPSEWFMIYSKDPDYFVHELLNTSEELRNILEFSNEKKFANELMNNDNFAMHLDKYASKNKIKLEAGSLFINPKNQKSMKEFIEQLSKDISHISNSLFKPKDFVKKTIDNYYLKRS